MKLHLSNKITIRLITIITLAFLFMNLIVIFFVRNQIVNIIDMNQSEIFNSKLSIIESAIDYEITLLNKTGMVRVYEDDFKERTLNSLRETFYTSESGPYFPILLAQGKLIMIHPDHSKKISQLSAEKLNLELNKNNNDFYIEINSSTYWCIYKTIEEWDWKILYIISYNSKYLELRSLLGVIISTLIIISIITLIFISFLLRNHLRPIVEVSKSAALITSGNLEKKIVINGKYEIKALCESFKKMQDSIRNTISELQDSREDLSTILDSIGDGVIATDEKFLIKKINPVAEKMTGWTNAEAIGKQLKDVFFLKERSNIPIGDPYKKLINNFDSLLIDIVKLISKNGQEYLISCKGSPIIYKLDNTKGLVLIFRDITEKIKMEEIMIQNEKMLSVGGLAAGMAHEINNPLAGIIQNANVIQNRLYTNINMQANLNAAEKAGTNIVSIKKFLEIRSINNMLESINEAGQRVSLIVSNMLNFSRKSKNEQTYENISDLIENTLKLASTDYSSKEEFDFKKIEIVKDFDKNIPYILCHKSKLQQVFLNILINGAHAMQESKTEKSKFIIKTYCKDGFVVIEFKDNGPGIDEDTKKRIFEPFFTTKGPGKGTGLGLSVSYFIICENHNGEMYIKSSPGEGANFIIKLPCLS